MIKEYEEINGELVLVACIGSDVNYCDYCSDWHGRHVQHEPGKCQGNGWLGRCRCGTLKAWVLRLWP